MSEPSASVLVLNPDIDITPVTAFPSSLVERLGGETTDFVVSDRTSRIGSQRVDCHTATFLRRFRTPRSIVEAVFEQSQELGTDPRETLNALYPLLRAFRLSAVLVDPAVERKTLAPGLAVGDVLAGYRVVACISELAETDVYKADRGDGRAVALKYVRRGASQFVKDNLRREVGALAAARRADCRCVPALTHAELDRDDPFVGLEWIDGETVFTVSRGSTLGLEARARVALSLLEGYAGLHAAGILHGDVHPSNIIVQSDGAVRIVDFGGARLLADDVPFDRIGLVHYYEPEVARAVSARQAPPCPTPLGEQYCVAAIVYALLTGSTPILLSLETEAALSQIAVEAPRPFTAFGIDWPTVEQALRRALHTQPEQRFPDLGELAAAFRQAIAGSVPERRRPTVAPAAVPKGLARPFDAQWRALSVSHGIGAELTRRGYQRGPTSSLYAGNAGVAYGLWRIAVLRNDAAALAAADVWSAHALSQQHAPLAFTDGSVGALDETGPFAFFHSSAGVMAVNACIRHAAGDDREADDSVAAFSKAAGQFLTGYDASRPRHFSRDATNGAASLLLGASWLWPLHAALTTSGSADADRSMLLDVGSALAALVVEELQSSCPQHRMLLGFAHGMSGALCALLRWAEATRTVPDERVLSALRALERRAHRSQGEMAWPIDESAPEGPFWSGWCHGGAGHVLTWVTAARVYADGQFLDTACAAGASIWRTRGQSGPSLCCGTAGEALACFELARATGAPMWIDRGRDLVREAVAHQHHLEQAQGLFRSPVGVALACVEAEDPSRASWPICQPSR